MMAKGKACEAHGNIETEIYDGGPMADERTEKEDIRKLIGKRVMGARTMKGYSQTELAKAMKVSRCTISNLENGKSMIGVDTLIELLETLNIGIDEIFPEYLSGRTGLIPGAKSGMGGADAERYEQAERERLLSDLELLMDSMITRRLENMQSHN